MTDPLSVSASIITLVGTGFAVAKGLYQVASGIGSAGQEVRVYADEIDSFAKLLAKIQEELDQRPQIASRRAQGLLEDIFAVCERVLDPMNHIQETLNPLLIRFKDSQSKLRQFGLRVQWMFATKDKLLFYRGALKSQHRLLDTTLTAMILMAVGQNPRIVIHQLSIENSIAGIKSILHDSKALQIENVGHSSSRLLLSGGNGTGTRGLPNDTSNDDGSIMTQEQGAADSIQALTLSTRPEDLSILHEANSDSESVDEIINETFEEKFEAESEDSAQDLWEDMRAVSRKVLRYASDALKDSREGRTLPNPPESAGLEDRPTPVSIPSGSNPALSTPGPTASSQTQSHGSTFDPAKSDGGPEMPVYPNPSQNHEASASSSLSHSPQTRASRVLNDNSRPASTNVESPLASGQEFVPNTDPTESLSVPINDSDSARQRSRSRASHYSVVQYPDEGNINIQFLQDKIYELPLSEVREWAQMHDFLLSIYRYQENTVLYDRYPSRYKDGSELESIKDLTFELVGPEGQIIVPRYWSFLVKTGWTILVLFPGEEYVKKDVKVVPKDVESMLKKSSRLGKFLKG